MSRELLQPGQVLQLGGAINISGLTVYVTTDEVMVSIGRIRKDYIKWFDQTDIQSILQNTSVLVYIEEGVFGIRQATDPWDEFKALSESNQRDVISKYIDLMNE